MKILLATDGSDCARAAVDFVAGFPFPADSTVTLLAVIDDRSIRHGQPKSSSDEHKRILQDAGQALYEDAEQLLAGENRRLGDAGRAGSTEIRTGNPAHEIIKLAEAQHSDLIVVGSHGSGTLRDMLLGHVSDRLLEYAPCSVLIVRTACTHTGTPGSAPVAAPPWRVVLAYDRSEQAQLALARCAALPFDTTAEITAVSVMPLVTAFRQDIRQHMNPIWQQKRHDMQVALEDAVSALDWSTPHVRTRLREGEDVAQEILAATEQTGSNLIMLGSKGEGAIKRFLLGSITKRIARHAPCSVWAVRR